MALNQFQNPPLDRRRLSDQDKRDYNRGSKEDVKSHKRVKARKRAMNWQEQSEPNTVERRPGSGGFRRGRVIQQMRLKEIGKEKRRAESLRTMQ